MIIDFHNHFYPEEYIEELSRGPSFYQVTHDEKDNPVLHSPGDYNIVVPGHRKIDIRMEVLKRNGVDKQVLTFTAPGTLVETPERSVELAKMVNNIFASIVRDHSQHFTALATLPLNHPESSVQELDRSINKLGLKGVMLFSNVNGIALSDERFWPLYEKANELHAVFFIHPTFPVGVEAMEEFMLMPLIGFTFDTTLAASKLVFTGIPERYPNIKWVLGHLGGAIPYLAERLDRGYEAFKECREYIDKPPSKYLKDFYYDTVNFDHKALELALDFAGADHLLAGSDYPHQIGSLTKMKDSISRLNISNTDKAKIYGENALTLLNA